MIRFPVPLRAWRTRSTGSRLYLGYISAISRLYLGYISAISRLYLGHSTAMSRLYLGYIYPQHGQQVLEGEDHRVRAGDLEGDRDLEAEI